MPKKPLRAKAPEMPHIFLVMTLIGVGAGVLVLLLAPALRSWIGDRK